jgi:hypothetical protein
MVWNERPLMILCLNTTVHHTSNSNLMEGKSCVVNELSHVALSGITAYRLHNLIPTSTKPINNVEC